MNADLLENELKLFYTTKYEKLTEILNGTSQITLRMLDYYIMNKMQNDELLWTSYQNQLSKYGSKYFNVYRRKNITPMTYENIDTTVGQLNLFRWILNNNVLEIVENMVKNNIQLHD